MVLSEAEEDGENDLSIKEEISGSNLSITKEIDEVHLSIKEKIDEVDLSIKEKLGGQDLSDLDGDDRFNRTGPETFRRLVTTCLVLLDQVVPKDVVEPITNAEWSRSKSGSRRLEVAGKHIKKVDRKAAKVEKGLCPTVRNYISIVFYQTFSLKLYLYRFHQSMTMLSFFVLFFTQSIL